MSGVRTAFAVKRVLTCSKGCFRVPLDLRFKAESFFCPVCRQRVQEAREERDEQDGNV